NARRLCGRAARSGEPTLAPSQGHHHAAQRRRLRPARARRQRAAPDRALRGRPAARARGRSRAGILTRSVRASPEIESKTSSELGLLPPPLWGRAGEGGWCGDMMMAPPEKHRTTPTPNPSPKGGGEHTEYAAALSIEHKDVLQITNVLRLQQ